MESYTNKTYLCPSFPFYKGGWYFLDSDIITEMVEGQKYVTIIGR